MREPLPKPQYRKQRKRKQEAEKLHRKSVRLLCYERDGYECIRIDCPNKKPIPGSYTTRFIGGVTHHHLVPLGKCGPDTLENSACLCPHCHELAQEGGEGLTSHQWNIRILAPYRNSPKWRWQGAWDWHIARVWRITVPKVTVKIENGAEIDLAGGDAQDVIELLQGKGFDQDTLATPGASVSIGSTIR